LPTTYVIDGAARKIGVRSGALDWAAPGVIEFFAQLLGNERPGPAPSETVTFGPAQPIAASLRVRTSGSAIRGRQDPSSELIVKLDRGEDLVTMGKAGGWYMVRTKAGAVGWIAEADVEEAVKGNERSSTRSGLSR
jgi:hypothetical protein